MSTRLLGILLLAGVVSAVAQKPAMLSGNQILRNVESNFAGIEDYTVSLDVAVDIERLKVPKMRATMLFKKPDKTRFMSDGFAMLPKEGIGFTPLSLNSRFEVLGVEEKGGQYHLTMSLRSDKTKLRRAIAVVNPANWTVAAIVTPQRDSRQMSAQFEYVKVDGHWLPAKLSVTFSRDTTENEPADPFGQMPGAQRNSSVPRKGSILVHYSDYRLNTGLKDDVFEEPADNPRK